MARKTPKQHQRHDEDSHDESLQTPHEPEFDQAQWDKENEALRQATVQVQIETAFSAGRAEAFRVCIAELKRFADESDSHGAIWERVLTKRFEALV